MNTYQRDVHCLSSACGQTGLDDAPPVCECDCASCAQTRRSPEEVLAKAYQAIDEPHQDFGDVGDILTELAESLAAVLRSQHGADSERKERE